MAKKQLGAHDIFFPCPAALIVSGHGKTANIITLAWVGMTSCSPPTLEIAVRKTRHSYELIRTTGAFTVNIPNAQQAAETDFCGMVSGNNVDKFAATGFTPQPSLHVASPIIAECPLNLECTVINEIEVGSHQVFIGEILEVHIDEKAMTDGKIDMSKANPLVYAATVGEYWRLGQKVADSFSAGLAIKHEKK